MWQPLRRLQDHERNPEQIRIKAKMGLEQDDEVWWSDRYQVCVNYLIPIDPDDQEQEAGRDGMLHLSIHSHTRSPARNWRHFQQIKNEVAGEDRWAFEVYPPEDKLVDTSNEYHLYVLPKGTEVPFAFQERAVSSDAQAKAFTANPDHKGRQEPWEPGLTTGHGRNDNPDPRLDGMLGVKSNEADIPKGKLKGIAGK